MSRSVKKPIIKDKSRNSKASTYYRRVRRVIKQKLKESDIEEVELPNSKEIVNDYDYMDYKWDLRNSKNKKLKTKYSRK